MGNVDKTWSSLALDYASSGLQDDIEVVVSAVEQNNEALWAASDGTRNWISRK
jgi:hypothetical protein